MQPIRKLIDRVGHNFKRFQNFNDNEFLSVAAREINCEFALKQLPLFSSLKLVENHNNSAVESCKVRFMCKAESPFKFQKFLFKALAA